MQNFFQSFWHFLEKSLETLTSQFQFLIALLTNYKFQKWLNQIKLIMVFYFVKVN